MLATLSGPDRLLLLRFLCAFAWTDLTISDKERRFVHRLVDRLDLSPAEKLEVEQWLAVAPAPGSVDPARIPVEHRRVFLDAVRALVYADGTVDPEERASLDRLRHVLAG